MNRWDDVALRWVTDRRDVLWRAHSDAVNTALLERWLPPDAGRVLKTDLFDEAVSAGLWPVLASRARRVVGIDLSKRVAAAARARYPDMEAVVGDVRRLPFAASSFDTVVSTSTLDHFRRPACLELALRELRRIMKPGGQLVLTMDNRANPLIALRNSLPYPLLHALGLVPYYVGYTCGPRRLERWLAEAGFETVETIPLLHCPRVFAVLAGRLLRGRGRAWQRAYWRGLSEFERLGSLPGRFISGHFIAIRALAAKASPASEPSWDIAAPAEALQ